MQVVIDDERRNFHGAAALLELGFSLRAEAAMRVGAVFLGAAGKDLGKLALLGGNLDHQALAQVARCHAGRIEMLDQFDGAADQLDGGRFVHLLAFGKLPQAPGRSSSSVR